MDTKFYNFKFVTDPSKTEQKSSDANLVLALAAMQAITITGDYTVDASGNVTATRGGGTGNGQSYP